MELTRWHGWRSPAGTPTTWSISPTTTPKVDSTSRRNTSLEFSNQMTAWRLKPSFGSVGDCLDNAKIESIWSVIKREIRITVGPWENSLAASSAQRCSTTSKCSTTAKDTKPASATEHQPRPAITASKQPEIPKPMPVKQGQLQTCHQNRGVPQGERRLSSWPEGGPTSSSTGDSIAPEQGRFEQGLQRLEKVVQIEHVSNLYGSTQEGPPTTGEASDEPPPDLQQQNRLSEAEVAKLLRARSDGCLINELAAQFGIHRTTVMAHIQRSQTAGFDQR